MAKNMGVSLGASMFMDWEQIDAALDKWAKGYFGEHAEAAGIRDENEFEISLGGLVVQENGEDDYKKYCRIFDVYDDVKDYEPEDVECFEDYGVVLPAELTKRLMVDVLGDNGLKVYGTALATYDGVFFMEQDRHAEKEIDRVVEAPVAPGWKVGSEVDELVVQIAHMAGEMEARKEIYPMDWEELCEAIRDAIHEYYENPSETNPFQVEDVAERVLKARFGEAKPLGEVLSNANERCSQGAKVEVEIEMEP